ncbi:uncharacterized protein FA14DRAFT_118543 [Meira miltonrushii]|uniref:Glycosyltransferase family 31 protein n=1 Tax=Meira miltonrushii TaxID=1280837 RepID=A0A316VSA4_9BASI|nr:uncharacterized protein FA14DRAFT_118543 [Meira miltonrushii]PWN38385.1 hypothetical protein FA14DRAFT_118543 [Meira miltonrushii]
MPNPLRAILSILTKSFRTCFGPIHPITIFIALLLIAGFVTTVTMTIMYILNPDKEPLPWRTYCQQQMPFPHQFADALAPVNVVVGVMTIDSKYERRNTIRSTYARHTLPVSKDGKPLANVQVKFILGRVRKAHAKRVALEMEAYNDIVVLDMDETQSARKTLSFFQWAAENATVPFLRPLGPAKDFKGDVADTFIPNTNAPGGLSNWAYDSSHDLHTPSSIGDSDGEKMRYQVAWRNVDYVVKADDDTFIVLSELERHLRVSPRRMTYWGYLVKNWFMGGEAYALSHDLVQWLANSPEASKTAKGKEDTRTPQWLALHPNRSSINWVSEHCWIYDHPKGNSPYSHGFLFPDHVEQIKLEARHGLSEQEIAYRGGERRAQSYSTVSKWHQKYSPPRNDLTVEEELEAMIEGGGRWEGAWVRNPDGSSSQSWTHRDDIVFTNDDLRLRPSSTNERGNAVLASDVGLELNSGLPIYGPVSVTNTTMEIPVEKQKAETKLGKRNFLDEISSWPRKLIGLHSSTDAKEKDDENPFMQSNARFLPRPTPKDEYGDWASLHARRYLNKPHGGTVIVHYLKKTEYWHETALILLGKAKLWDNGAGGLGKQWRMGGSPLVRSNGYITEGRSAPKRAFMPITPEAAAVADATVA